MSKVQFNLLPDIKLEYNRTQRMKTMITTVATLVTAGSLALLILLVLTVDIVQKKQLTDSANDIDTASKQLKNVPQIDQIITVQNQLKTLSELHQSKHISSRIFTYLPKLTPPNLTINKLDMDLKANTMVISGKASAQSNVNAFADATLSPSSTLFNSSQSSGGGQ
jgi:Tfp pilus assembly protein PilN